MWTQRFGDGIDASQWAAFTTMKYAHGTNGANI
jgi:hypothetical protein